MRICGDYKITVNGAAKLDKYPIPRINGRGKAFTKLDLSHASLQIPLDEESRQYVVINTHKGLFEYTRLPFGVASAPSIFQRVMENQLQGINCVCIYIDDTLKKEKCAFLLPSVYYLGHVISAEGTEDSKVRAIINAPEPRHL